MAVGEAVFLVVVVVAAVAASGKAKAILAAALLGGVAADFEVEVPVDEAVDAEDHGGAVALVGEVLLVVVAVVVAVAVEG